MKQSLWRERRLATCAAATDNGDDGDENYFRRAHSGALGRIGPRADSSTSARAHIVTLIVRARALAHANDEPDDAETVSGRVEWL